MPVKLAFASVEGNVRAGDVFLATVEIQDAGGNTVADATSDITVAVTNGTGPTGAAFTGTLTRKAASGVAGFTNLKLNRPGSYTLTATSGNLAPATSEAILVTPGAPAYQFVNAGQDQVAPPNSEVAVRPAVMITDTLGNAVAGVSVVFAVTSGEGTVTGATQSTGADGIATVGGWTLGSSGNNTLSATATALSIPPAIFSARVSLISVSSITPNILTPGVSATITGSGFSATAADNVVTVGSTPAAVTAATPTEVSFTVPTTLPCAATHDGTVTIAIGADFGSKVHTIQAAKQRVMGAGESLIVSSLDEVRCNELASSGGLYYISVFNTSRAYSSTGAQFELRGSTASGTAASLMASGSSARAATLTQPRLDLRRVALPVVPAPVDEGERLHARILEENIRDLQQRAPALVSRLDMQRLRAAPTKAYAVGDMQTVRLPDARGNVCNAYFERTTRVAYAGTRAIILEDVSNDLYNRIDSTYTAVGQEFDGTMFGILESNFGNPLAMDAATDNNGKIVMVFSDTFNLVFPGLAGFVVSCDFFPRDADNQSSNFGEYFYARVPTEPGTLQSGGNTPPLWRWSMRSTIIHEVKHITSFAQRIANGGCCEESWLEESSARLSEELYERSNYSFVQRENILYGSAADPRGPYCGVRACNGQPRGIARIFEDLNLNWYRRPDTYSPLGRLNGSDFSFYNTAWSLLRWAIDHSPGPEADFIKALVAGPERGLANLESRAGRAYEEILPEWAFAMALDDYPGMAFSNARLLQPSWHMRNLMEGLAQDFSNYTAWPFSPPNRTFGDFSVVAQVVPGTAAFVAIGGEQSLKQLIELKSADSSADAPAELRIAITRIQ